MYQIKSPPHSADRITLIGAGLAGCVLAIYLARRGFVVDIYERRYDMRKVPFSGGRSINLTLSARGIYVLKQIGLYEEVMKAAIPLKGRMMHSLSGELAFQPYGRKNSEVLYSIARNQFNIALMNEAEKYANVRIHFNQQCAGMNFDTGELKLRDETNGQQTALKASPVIGTDGSASALRMSMLKERGFNFSQSYLNHGYKELTIAAGPNGEFLLEKNALHIWPRGQYMLCGFPNLDGSFTALLFAPFYGEESWETWNSKIKVTEFFKRQFPDTLPLMPALVEKYFAKTAGSLLTIKCDPWHVRDKALLLGDAAHAIVPFHGQGMNCALEDCAYLDECVEKYGTNWKKVFPEFQKQRKVNTDAIADLSLENYIELRDRVANPKFLLKKKVELALSERYPNDFIPNYSMLAFHRIPYSEARDRGIIQTRIVDELCEEIEALEEVSWEKADFLVSRKLLKTADFTEPYSLPAVLRSPAAAVPFPAGV
ncbi:FAD-dependent oxidoreductase [Kamptonema formosum]|uniref:FAD-dependent oxidoreductase n=1 Tax=Kamptonema formosum TaxID=331992 RepID=UPI00034649E4|nr:NAD(P)/FAD-dependent oxidoreductase [Oscillatoria sp. PCC 10802]